MTDTLRWKAELNRLRERHRVPGVQLGILQLDQQGRETERLLVESGVSSMVTGDPVRRDSSFQIGSITKVVTAAATMRAAELGLLSIDDPVCNVLPELSLADKATAEAVTMADLLAHRSGIEGERYRETGEDAGAIARYVNDMGDAQQVHPLRAGFSYSNSAYVIAGRALEVATDTPWWGLVRELITESLGLSNVAAPIRPDEVTWPVIGHAIDAHGQLTRADPWRIPPGMAPAGILTADASDVLDLLALSLRGGTAADGSRVLTRASADALAFRSPPTGVPGVDGWGLGWMREHWGNEPVFGHDGGTNGQFAFARAVPDHGIAYVLLTNGGHARAFYEELFPLLGAETIASPGPEAAHPAGHEAEALPDQLLDLSAGRYRNGDGDVVLAFDSGRSVAGATAAGATVDMFSPVLPAASGNGFVWRRHREAHWRTLLPIESGAGLLDSTRRMRRVPE